MCGAGADLRRPAREAGTAWGLAAQALAPTGVRTVIASSRADPLKEPPNR
ncbi:hypothetical protein [Streptomyces sp. NRRL B-1140]|nr:hypothetical protein [Streptomyces sp. NRRL B-1140]